MDTLHMASKHIAGELTAIVKALLGKGTREAMLAWLGGAIEGNAERAKMQMDLRVSWLCCFCYICGYSLHICYGLIALGSAHY
jgi:hypothetical protein